LCICKSSLSGAATTVGASTSECYCDASETAEARERRIADEKKQLDAKVKWMISEKTKLNLKQHTEKKL